MKFFRSGSFAVMSSLLFASSTLAAPDALFVSVRDAKLRSRAEFWSPTTSDLAYGDQLSVLSANGDWFRVKDSRGHEGFIHQSAITDRKVVLKSSAQFSAQQADQNDVVLAGKGFNSEVEKKYAAGNHGVNFPAVNAMEQRKVSQRELADFIGSGQLGKKES
ncbi:MAG: SH3 domain-containing protein [Bdellovibrionota bacterium]